MKKLVMVTALAAVFISLSFAQTQAVKPEVTGEAKKPEISAPEKKASGKLEDVTVTAEDKSKVKSEKPLLELNMDINEPVLLSLETEKKFLEKSPVLSELKNTLPKMLSTGLVAAPYYDIFVKEPVAVFSLKEAGYKTSKWDFLITDQKGKVFKKFAGSGTPPKNIEWSGRNNANKIMKVGNPYSYLIDLVDTEGKSRKVMGAPFVVNQLVHQEADGLYLSVTRKKIFDAEKEKTKILKEGMPLLREMSNYLKDMPALPARIEVYGEDALTASGQAKELAKYFTNSLILPENSIKYNGNEASLEESRIELIIKNRADAGPEMKVKEIVLGEENTKIRETNEISKFHTDSINVEGSLHDFIVKSMSPVIRLNTLLLAANYKIILDPSRELAAAFGPFFCLAEGDNDLGLRAAGYFYPYPNQILNMYASITGGGALGLAKGKNYLFSELKLGAEIKINEVELFGEGGLGLRTGNTKVNLLVSAGVRYYVYPEVAPEKDIKKPGLDDKNKKLEAKQDTGLTHSDRINIELSLHDFFAKNLYPAFRINTFLLAASYKITDPSKEFTAAGGPFFCLAEGNNDLGLRASGYYYPFPNDILNIYGSIMGAGVISLASGNKYLSGEVKLGAEIKISEVELFGEGGVGLRTGNNKLNLLVSAGARYYIY